MSRREVGEAVLPLIRGIGEGVYHFISLSSPSPSCRYCFWVVSASRCAASTSFLCSLGISSMKSSSVVRRSLAELSCVAKYDLRSAVS
jgi:hypothetical protein